MAMKVENTTVLKVLAKIEKKGASEQTKDKTYYSLVVLQGTESYTLSVPEEVYTFVKEGETVSFATEYREGIADGKVYSYFRIIGFANKNQQKTNGQSITVLNGQHRKSKKGGRRKWKV